MIKKAKKVTLETLAATMEAGFKHSEAELKQATARMEAGFKHAQSELKQVEGRMDVGFKRLDGKMDAGFKKVNEDIESLARMTARGFEDTANNIAKLEQGQENIQLRVDNLAPTFEVRSLERRVKRLEDKTGIRHTIPR